MDTNQAFLGERCRRIGIVVRTAVSVRDRMEEIVVAVRDAAARDGLCLVSGGLGPTTDDLTAAALADAAGVPLVRDAQVLAEVERKFQALGRPMAPSNAKQADLPRGCQVLANPIGTAPGFAMDVGACRLFCMPGVPRELQKMMRERVEPQLSSRLDLQPVSRRTYRVVGMGESSLAERVEPIVAVARARGSGLAGMLVHYRASHPEVTLSLEATPDDTGRMATAEELATLDEPLFGALSPALYGIGEASLAARLVDALTRAGVTLALAESCTGGGAAAAVAAVPGASAGLAGAVVAYADAVKVGALGVSPELLADCGAVSEPVARAMADGVRVRLGADLSVAVTGIAGPSGGSPEKPVGTVHFAVSDRDGCLHRRIQLHGNRGTVQRAAALWALKLAWDRLVAAGRAVVQPLD